MQENNASETSGCVRSSAEFVTFVESRPSPQECNRLSTLHNVVFANHTPKRGMKDGFVSPTLSKTPLSALRKWRRRNVDPKNKKGRKTTAKTATGTRYAVVPAITADGEAAETMKSRISIAQVET